MQSLLRRFGRGAFATLAVLTLASAASAQKKAVTQHSNPQKSGAFFRVEQHGDVWQLITPQGKPFFSLGVCCVGKGPARAAYPAHNPQYASFRFYPSHDDWAHDTFARLRVWNFNTIGGWSDAEVQTGTLPYTKVLHVGASVAPAVPWGDIFDPAYAARLDEIVKKQVVPLQSDANLIGYFTDNELGWWDDTIFLHVFHQPRASKTRGVLINVLRAHYRSDFARLQRDFNVGQATSFDTLTPEVPLTLRPGGAGVQAIEAFVYRLGTRYYRLMHDSIRRYDKNHLILGDRYLQWYVPAVARAAAPYVDVISTNYGADWLDGTNSRYFLDTLHELTGKPILITEFYFAARENRSGNKNTGAIFPTVQTQRERAASYRNYVAQIASRPFMVGTHWFQYYDEPTQGRGDGEDYNMGLVDINNVPYEQLTASATAIHRKVLALHTQKRARQPEKPLVPAASAHKRDDLAAWDKSRGFVPAATRAPVADLYACWDAGNLYVAVQGIDFLEPKLYPDGKVPQRERMQWRVRVGHSQPVQAWLGAEKDARDDTPLPLRMWSRGLKSYAVLTIPASYLKRKAFKRGDEIPISAQLNTHSRAERVGWKATLRLGT